MLVYSGRLSWWRASSKPCTTTVCQKAVLPKVHSGRFDFLLYLSYIRISADAIVRFSDVEIFDNDPKLKCYMSCLFLEAGLTDDDGQLHLEKLVDTVNLLDDTSQLIFLKMAKRCLRPVKTDACESAFWFHKCWKTADPVHYFLY